MWSTNKKQKSFFNIKHQMLVVCVWLTDQRAAHCAPGRLQNVKWICFSSYSASTEGLLLNIDLRCKCLVVDTPLGWRYTAEWYTAGTQGDLEPHGVQFRQLHRSKWELICGGNKKKVWHHNPNNICSFGLLVIFISTCSCYLSGRPEKVVIIWIDLNECTWLSLSVEPPLPVGLKAPDI